MRHEPSPLLPVGLDCDCGHPMVWYGAEQRCSVYGRHLPNHERLVRFRDMNAPLADVVDLFAGLAMPDCRRSRKADYGGAA